MKLMASQDKNRTFWITQIQQKRNLLIQGANERKKKKDKWEEKDILSYFTDIQRLDAEMLLPI